MRYSTTPIPMAWNGGIRSFKQCSIRALMAGSATEQIRSFMARACCRIKLLLMHSLELIVPIGYAGIVDPRDYANRYYRCVFGTFLELLFDTCHFRDFLYYSRKTNPDALIMSRPVDSYGPIYWQFSPRDVVLSGKWLVTSRLYHS